MAGEGFADPSDAGRVGGIASGESRRAKRDAAVAKAEEAFDDMLEHALSRHAELLDSEDDGAAIRALREVYDRRLGRASQRIEHSGRVEVDITAARAKLDSLLSKRGSE